MALADVAVHRRVAGRLGLAGSRVGETAGQLACRDAGRRDGVDDETSGTLEPASISGLTEVDHHGRVAWQADLRPNPSYDPRCGCCPLLFSKASEDWEADAGGPTLRERDPTLRYADAHRVRLDVATGVCVYTEELGGTHAGSGHEMRIEAVDKPMHDALFT